MIEPDDELRARICAWAEKKCVNLDALEVATAKLRRHRLWGTLSDPAFLSAAFPKSRSLPLPRQASSAYNSMVCEVAPDPRCSRATAFPTEACCTVVHMMLCTDCFGVPTDLSVHVCTIARPSH